MPMLRLWVYGYATGRRSSRQIEGATYEEVPFRYLASNRHPDHDIIAAFGKENLDLFTGLFLQVLKLCQQAGSIKLGHIAIDGAKLQGFKGPELKPPPTQ